jgi:hypothetical protein
MPDFSKSFSGINMARSAAVSSELNKSGTLTINTEIFPRLVNLGAGISAVRSLVEEASVVPDGFVRNVEVI